MARGAAEDKSNVIAPLKAIKAIMDTIPKGSHPPCTFKVSRPLARQPNLCLPLRVARMSVARRSKSRRTTTQFRPSLASFAPSARHLSLAWQVLVGGAAPANSPAIETPEGKLEDLKKFLQDHKADLNPDYVIVSAPGGVDVCPGAAAAIFSCRGFLTAEVSVKTITPTANPTACFKFVGPVIDPNTVLMGLASLRAPDGSLAIPGLTSFSPSAGMMKTIEESSFSETQLRTEAGSVPSAVLAPSNGLVPEVKAGEERNWLPSVVFEPGLTITALTTAPGPTTPNNPSWVQHQVAPEASASIYMNLPPGDIPEESYAKLEAAIQAALGSFGAEVSVTYTGGRAGFLSDPDSPFFQSLVGAMKRHYGPTRAAMATGDPSFQAVGSAFSDIFSDAGVFMAGVNDPQQNLRGADESVAMTDVSANVKTMVTPCPSSWLLIS